MGQQWKAYWLEPTDQERVWLRRYRSSTLSDANDAHKCPLPWGYHDAMVLLRDRPLAGLDHMDHPADADRPADNSPLWPVACACGYVFLPEDERQVFNMRLYSGAPDGKLYALRDCPPGGMWNAAWLAECAWATGPDGISLHVKLPNGHDWCVDQEASNCTRKQWQSPPGQPNTKQWMGRTHYCWVRHGDPRTGNVHVDKKGNTCQAGAGSIKSGSFHGFLHHGFLKDDK